MRTFSINSVFGLRAKIVRCKIIKHYNVWSPINFLHNILAQKVFNGR